MKTAVTGAYSYSGKYIASRLLAEGHDVITLTNHPHRNDPFDGKVPAFPLYFNDHEGLISSLAGVNTLVNTYWVRFDRGANTHAAGVQNTAALLKAAAGAGVERIVHVSITNPTIDSNLPYFRGKAMIEALIRNSGLSHAILRPTVLFGKEDILINNIAFLLRRFPIFAIPGKGDYSLQPIYVDDLAKIAVHEVGNSQNKTLDVVGPEMFTFKELVDTIAKTLGQSVVLVHLPPTLVLVLAQVIGLFTRDVVLTNDEIRGLTANLLVSRDKPLGETRLTDWLKENRNRIGARYASELEKHYR